MILNKKSNFCVTFWDYESRKMRGECVIWLLLLLSSAALVSGKPLAVELRDSYSIAREVFSKVGVWTKIRLVTRIMGH